MAFKTPRDVPHKGYQALHEQPGQAAQPVEGVVVEEVKEGTSTALVPTTQADLALYSSHIFSTPSARSTISTAVNHKLTWFTGNNKCRSLDGRPLPDIAGLAIEVPNDECARPEDDALFETMHCLCKQGWAAEVIVTQGSGDKVHYWSVPTASLFVVAQGCADSDTMLGGGGRTADAVQLSAIAGDTRWGVAYGWPNGLGDDGKPKRSQIAFAAFIKEMMEAEDDDGTAYPYNAPFIFRFNSHCTEKAIALLRSHYRVLKAGDVERAKKGEAPAPFYGCALKMGCSPEPKAVGIAPNTREVYYPVPLAPSRRQGIPADYLASVVISREQAEIVEDNGRVEDAVAWSIAQSRRIILARDADADIVQPDGMVTLGDDDNPF